MCIMKPARNGATDQGPWIMNRIGTLPSFSEHTYT